LTNSPQWGNLHVVKQQPAKTAAEIEAELSLNRALLRIALSVAGSDRSTPEANAVAGRKAQELKEQIAQLEPLLKSAA